MVAWALGPLFLEFLPPISSRTALILFTLYAGLPGKVWRMESIAKNSLNETRIVLSFYRWGNWGLQRPSDLIRSSLQHSQGKRPRVWTPNPSLPQEAVLCTSALPLNSFFGYWGSGPVVLKRWSSDQPGPSASLGNLSEVQILGPHPRPIRNSRGETQQSGF